MFDYDQAVPSEVTLQEIRSFVDRLARAGCPGSPLDQIDMIAALEALKSASCALQAETSVVYDAARRSAQAAAGVAPDHPGGGPASL